jgi:hypothetical protein
MRFVEHPRSWADPQVEAFPALGQKGLLPQPLDHALARLCKIANLANDRVHFVSRRPF